MKKKPDCLIVQEWLTTFSDFATARVISLGCGVSTHNTKSALCHLRKYGVVDSVESNGCLWWFITGLDTRQSVLEERALEAKPRRQRKQRIKVLPLSEVFTKGETK